MHFGFRFPQLTAQGLQFFPFRSLLLGQLKTLLGIIVLARQDVLQFLHQLFRLVRQLYFFLFTAANDVLQFFPFFRIGVKLALEPSQVPVQLLHAVVGKLPLGGGCLRLYPGILQPHGQCFQSALIGPDLFLQLIQQGFGFRIGRLHFLQGLPLVRQLLPYGQILVGQLAAGIHGHLQLFVLPFQVVGDPLFFRLYLRNTNIPVLYGLAQFLQPFFPFL